VTPPDRTQDDPKHGPTRVRSDAAADQTRVAPEDRTRVADATLVAPEDDDLSKTPNDATLHRPSGEISSPTRARMRLRSPDDPAAAPATDSQSSSRSGQPYAGTAARTWHAPSFPDPEVPEHVRTLQAQPRAISDADASLDAIAHDGFHGELQPGSVIKQRFLLDSMIGKGGMGLVFSAIDRRKEEARDPNPRVALKVLNADFRIRTS
jgi:hypothetical protein